MEGASIRGSLAQAITECTLAVISSDDYLTVQNLNKHSVSGGVQMSVDAKYNFLLKVPMLRGWVSRIQFEFVLMINLFQCCRNHISYLDWLVQLIVFMLVRTSRLCSAGDR